MRASALIAIAILVLISLFLIQIVAGQESSDSKNDKKEDFSHNDYTAVLLDGKNDFLKIPSPDISKEISGFTVSVWTKPNYQSGSPKFSIISMKNTFELSINNNLEPEKIAMFSIFDGIKWQSIQSKSLVNEEWTHIAATFSDSSISIFINGNKENTLDNIKTISIDDGQYVISSLTSISVESDILVGAYENSEVDSFRSYYSGLIDSVVVFDSALDLGQNALNEKSRELDYSTLSENKTQQVDETFQAEPNQFGFVANEEQNNSQEIEEQGSKGFKLQKEDKKKVHEFDDEIEDDEIEFEGKIDEINLESMFFTLVGLILQIFVNDDTEFDEDFDSLNDLAPGFHVDVDVVLSNGSHIATEIEVDEEETEEEKEKEEEEEEEKENKIKICHVPPGNPDNAHTIEVDESAVEAHLKHGDSLGPCDEPPEETFTVTLKDSVSLQDDVTASKQAPSTFTVTLKDSVSLQDDVTASKQAPSTFTVTLEESISLQDQAEAIVSTGDNGDNGDNGDTGATGATGDTGGTDSSRGGGGGGRTGLGPSRGGGGIIGVEFDILSESIHLYEVSWNVCEDNLIKVIAGPSGIGLSVKARTTILGLVIGTLAQEQPYETKSVYDIRVDPRETFAQILLEVIENRQSFSIKYSIHLKECQGSVEVYKEPEQPTSVSQETEPEIPTTAKPIPGGQDYDIQVNDKEFNLSYKANGTINDVDINQQKKSVTFGIYIEQGGSFMISLPRGFLDANNDEFKVYVGPTKQETNYIIIESGDDYIILEIPLESGDTEFTIVGTKVIPEFDAVTAVILSASFVIFVMVTKLGFKKLRY